VGGDIDVLTSTGEVYTRITGWESRRFDVPAFYIQHSYSPRDFLLCQRWPEAEQLAGTAGAGDAQVYRIAPQNFPSGFFDSSGGVWQKSLALTILSRREREIWLTLKTTPLRRLEWLLGRSAAKDAVRSYAKDHFGIVLPPADIEIEADSSGRPRASGGWVHRVPFVPHLSIAHSSGTAVAIVTGDCCNAIGIDLEHVSRLNDDVIAAGFGEAERRLLEVPGSEVVEWALRLWCAKEAAAKALGHGFRHQPRSFRGDAISSDGAIDIIADGEQPQQGAAAVPAAIRVLTAFDGEFALAVCPLTFSTQQGMYERNEQLA
jgi:4'-phosphopantetheinyl transferase EntD